MRDVENPSQGRELELVRGVLGVVGLDAEDKGVDLVEDEEESAEEVDGIGGEVGGVDFKGGHEELGVSGRASGREGRRGSRACC